MAIELELDESSLTGETHSTKKCTDQIERKDTHLADRINCAFMGTLVRSGNGQGIVIATGMRTEFGCIFGLMKDIDTRKTPLQNSMDQLGTLNFFLSLIYQYR